MSPYHKQKIIELFFRKPIMMVLAFQPVTNVTVHLIIAGLIWLWRNLSEMVK